MSLKRSASQVSPQALSLLVLYPNIPDEPPKAAVASPGLACGSASRASRCCLGGFLSSALPRALQRSLFGHTLSERRGCSTPRGFAYCESSREWWVGSPAGQHLSFLSSRPLSVITWDCASSLAPARLSRAPRSGCDSPPRPLPGVSPFQTQGVSISLTHLLLVVHNTTLTQHHSSSPCLVTPSVAS